MSATVELGKQLESLHYGAVELKQVINRNTYRAFRITAILLLLISTYAIARPFVEAWLFPPPNIVKVRVTRASLESLPPPPSENQEEMPPPPPENLPPATVTRAGTPVAVPDAEIAPDAKDFADLKDLGESLSSDRKVDQNEQWSEIPSGPAVVRDETPDIEEFVSVEVEPAYDEGALARRVKYPEMARRNGIEGIVLVGALIGKDGRIEKIQVIESDNEVLNSAAVKAVQETTFTPAKQNGQAVRVWARVPIRFTLR